MENGTLRVVKSSAGSGKTYALVLEYLRIALSKSQASWYRHILAITFTNAAAAEMKERVLSKLSGLAEGPGHRGFDGHMESSLISTLGISSQELRERSSAVFSHMLHHYGWLSISTIDSFVHRLIRSFSKELKLSGDFGITTNIDEFNSAITDKLLSFSSDEHELKNYITQFALDNFEEGKQWNLRQTLDDFAKLLQDEKTIPNLERLSEYSLKDFSEARKIILKSRAIFESDVTILAEKGLQLIRKNAIPFETFSYQSLPNYFLKNLKKKYDLMGVRLKSQVESGIFYPKKTSSEHSSKLDKIAKELCHITIQLEELISGEQRKKYEIQGNIISGIAATGLLHKMHTIGNEIRKEKNIVLISDFHSMISRVIDDNDAPFIYEKYGERFHYILFDEFQDTSFYQWKNFLPLIQNSLSEGYSGFVVGDGKQAIYRWRNGNVEQFINLPEISLDNVAAKNIFRISYREEFLGSNYRSAETIVKFNNGLFNFLKENAGRFSAVYSNAEQKPEKRSTGYVAVQSIVNAKQEDRLNETLDVIFNNVRETIDDGFLPNEIAILTRKNLKEAGLIAQYLVDKGIEVETSESFLLKQSSRVQALIYTMKHQLNPGDSAINLLLAESLINLHPGRISIEELHTRYTQNHRKQFTFNFEKFLDDFYPDTSGVSPDQFSVHQFLLYFIMRYQLEIDEYLEFLLDTVNSKSKQGAEGLAGFLDWWEINSEKLFIPGHENPNAVKIMTVHKSKGLEFPVVIYPRFETKSQAVQLWINTNKEYSPLPVALVKFHSLNDFSPDEFKVEEEKKFLDELNLAYVGCTRAEQRLYLLVELSKEDKEEDKQTLNDTIVQFALQYLTTSENRWELGVREKPIRKQKSLNDEPENIALNPEYPLLLRANSPSGEHLSDHKARKHGEFIHSLLALYEPGDTSEMLKQKAARRLRIPDNEKEELIGYVFRIIESPVMKRWFDASNRAKSEAEIFGEDGSILRPDRIVYYKDHIEVVDFKTGGKRNSYEEQVRIYALMIQQLEQLPVQAFIAYTDTTEVEEVLLS